MPYGNYKRYRGRKNYGLFQRSSPYYSRSRYGYRQRNSYNRSVAQSVRRRDTALALRGWVPGGVVEKKYNDVTFTAQAVNTTVVIGSAFAIAQGAGVTQRIGNKILVKSIQFIGTFIPQNAGTAQVSTYSPSQMVRMLVLVDKQPNGALPAASDVFESGTNVFSPINLSNRDRFVVIKDKMYTLGPAVSTATANQYAFGGDCIRLCKFYKKLRLPVTFGGSTSAITDLRTNNIIVVLFGSVATGTNDAQLDGYMRVRYVDA